MKTEMARQILFFIVLMLHLSAEQISIDNAPRILTDNGDIIFQTASSKSIRFETLTGGQIHLNNMDLGLLSNQIQSIKSAVDRIQDLRNCNCELINTNIGANSRSIQDLNSELRNAKNQIASFENSVNQFQEKLNIDNCANNPCHNGGTCINGYNSFKCICPENYKGVNCNEDVDECSQRTGTDLGCQNNARCENFMGGFRCVCSGKWSGILCNVPLNGCSGSSNSQLCGHGTCIPDHSTSTSDSFKCICDSGWALDQSTKTCINDVDECRVGRYPCSTHPLVTCINLPGHFTCDQCPLGFDGNGFHCNDKNECAAANICGINEECINTFGSYKCQCIEGMRKGINGICQMENICELNNGGCNLNAQCIMNRFRVEGRTCICNSGYTGNGEGPTGCQISVPSNSTNRNYRRCVRRQQCLNGGRCEPTRNSFRCICAPGFTGSRCRVSVSNPCSRNPCLNEGRCESLPPNHYRCHCKPFYTGVNCQNEHSECGGNFISPREEKNITLMISQTSLSARSFRFPCIWTVFVTSEQFIQIIPTTIQLSGPCSEEYILLEEKASLETETNIIGRYCQESNSSPKSYNSSGSILIIKAVLRHGNPQIHGFHLKIRPRDFTPENLNCCRCLNYGFVITNSTNGIFQSPHYPLKYPLNTDCTMEFERTFGERYKIELQIKILDLGDRTSNCESTDFLKITFVEKGETIITACNQERFQNKRYITSGFKIQFHSDSIDDSSLSRFQLKWKKTTLEDNCGSIVPFIIQGFVSVPSLSSEEESYCVFKIQHINSSRLISFKGYFDNWVRGDCSVSLMIKNIDNEKQHKILWQTCQTQKMLENFHDQVDGDLIIIFKKSKGVSTLPFRITLDYVCGQSVDMDRISEYQFQSDNYPDNYDGDLSCIYKLKAKTRRVAITFLDFDINDENPCASDYLKIKGSNTNILNQKFCNGNRDQLIPTVTSNALSESLELLFKTNSSISGRGFQIKVTVLECGGSYFIKYKLYVAYPEAYLNISTFHLGHEYERNKNCIWEFYSAPGTYMFAIFDHFHLEYHANCRYDYLTATYDNQTKVFCGNVVRNIFTKSNKLKIQFVSDYSVAGEGFKFRLYTSVFRSQCHEEIDASEGIIFSPIIGTLARPYLCYYRISVPTGRKVVLNITIGGADTSRSGYPGLIPCFGQAKLKITNGEVSSSTITSLCLSNPQKDPIMSSHNVVTIVYLVPTYRSASEFNFTIAFSSIEEECGSIINDTSGEIASQNYPLFAPRNSYCIWHINSSPGRKIYIKIVHIRSGSVDETSTCNNKQPVIKFQTASEEIDISCTDHTKFVHYFDDQSLKIIFNNQYNDKYRFRLLYKKVCTYTSDSMNGRIESDNLIFGNPSYCLWTLMPLRGSSVSIQIDEFDLPPPVNGICTSFVEISDKTGNLLTKTCGSSLQNRTFSSSNLPILVKHYIHRRTSIGVLQAHKGLIFEYQAQGCVYNINYDPTDDATYHNLFQRTGTIQSYQYPNSVSNIDCAWTFKTIPGYSIKITFDVIELDSFLNCTEGPILRAWEGTKRKGDHVLEICDKINPGQSFIFHSSTNNLYLQFMSADDSNGGQRKFHGNYSFVNTSCEYELKTTQGIIQSTNYPNNYPHNLRCKWHMKSREGTSIHLQFLDFDLENHQCRHDYVEILAPFLGDLMGLPKMCGKKENISNTIYQSIHNEIILKFHTDGSVAKKGFKAKFYEGCGGLKVAHEVNQFILSPNYPNSYSLTDGICDWVIVANQSQPGLRIFFYFMGFEGIFRSLSDNCSLSSNETVDNSLTVIDGYEESAPVKAILCTNQPYHPIVSTSHYLRIILKSSTGHAIFKAGYGTGSSACGGEFYLNDGLMTSPFYPNMVNMEIDCFYIIKNSPGSEIDLSIEELTRQTPQAYQYHDFIEIRNGSNSTSPLVGRYYNYLEIKNATKDARFPNSIWLRLRSQGGNYTNTIKFLARYHINYITDFRADQGFFASPQFGHVYNQDTRMTWRIEAETTNAVDISFDQFNVGRRLVDGECSRGQLTITDGNNNVYKFCGSIIPERQTFLTPISVSLTADGYRYPGFYLRWSIPINESHTELGQCSYMIQATSDEQILTSPNFPNFDPINRNCNWNIVTDVHKALEVKMLNFSLEHSVNCKYENFTASFYGKRGPTYRYGQWISKTFCGTLNISEFNFLNDFHFSRIKFDFKVDEFDLFPGFKLSYKIKCFRDIFDSYEGWIQNDEYPNFMTEKKNCTYLLRLDGERSFQLNFTGLNLPEKTNGKCENGYLEISTLFSREKYCGSQITSNLSPLLTNSSIVFINLVGDFRKYSSYSGFKLKYSLDEVEECGGSHSLSTPNDYLIITNPRNKSEYSPNYIECQWVIKSPYGTKLKIDFENVLLMGDCTNNYLAFYDGSTRLAKRIGDKNYCSKTSSLYASGNIMLILFKVHRGYMKFQLRVSLSKCGGLLYRSNGYISSPNYPSNYPPKSNCTWIIDVGFRGNIVINVLDLRMNLNCSYSNLTVFSVEEEESKIIWNNCNNLETSFHVMSNKAKITFISNSTLGLKGFRLQYKSNRISCGGKSDDPSRELTSLNYPASLPNYVSCWWKLDVDLTKRITLQIRKLNLERGCLAIIGEHRAFKKFICNLNYENYEIDTKTSSINLHLYSMGRSRLSFYYHSNLPSMCGYHVRPDLNETGMISIQNVTFCKYRFHNFPEAEGTIALTLLKLQGFGCQDANIQLTSLVYTGQDESIVDDLRWCNISTDETKFVTLGKQIDITYAQYTSINSIMPNILIQYQYNRCGGLLTEPFGYIRSPGYPDTYPNYANCEWVLQAPNNKHIKLIVENLHLEAHSTCSYDYLFIRYGSLFNSPHFRSYCGQHQIENETLIFRNNQLRLSFHSDFSVTKDGFLIKYVFFDAVDNCNGILFDVSGSIMSPNYPQPHPNHLNCNWTIILPHGYQVKVTFPEPFDIERTHDGVCRYDYLTIYDSNPNNTIATLCGHVPPSQPILSSANRMGFVFNTDYSHNLAGFKAVYESVCGGTFNESLGYINSPNAFIYSSHYLKCLYLVPHWKNHLTVLYITSNLRECDRQYGHVYIDFEDRFGNFYFNRKICGLSKSKITIIHSGSIRIRYNFTSHDVERYSFKATYLHDENLKVFNNLTTMVYIKTPQFPSPYHHNADLTWKFDAPLGYYFYIKLMRVDIEPSTYECSYDYLAIYNSNITIPSNRVNIFCGNFDDMAPFKIESNLLTIHFVSDASHFANHSGFEALVKPTPGPSFGCGGNINVTSGIIGKLSSLDLNNDGVYDDNLKCEWTLSASYGNAIRIRFENSSVDMEKRYKNRCMYDYLAIYDGLNSANLITILCNGDQIDPITTLSNNMVIMFETDINVAGRGFKLTYEAVASQGHVILSATNSSQVWKSPQYPNDTSYDFRILAEIDTIDENDHIIVEVKDLNIRPSANCTLDQLVIQDVSLRYVNKIRKICKAPRTPIIFISSHNRLIIQYQIGPVESTNTIQQKRFLLNFQIFNCTRLEQAYSGSIVNVESHKQRKYSNNQYCNLTLKAPDDNLRYQFYFKRFHLEMSTTCNYDYIQFIFGKQNEPKYILPKLCGTSLPASFVSNSSQVSMIFVTDQTINSEGFDITYVVNPDPLSKCGGDIESDSGAVTSPGFGHNIYESGECKWNIALISDRVIKWKITDLQLGNSTDFNRDCENVLDYVKITSESRIWKYCGNNIGDIEYTLSSSKMSVEYKSTNGGTGIGFRIEWGAVFN